MTDQEIFDKVTVELLKQGRRSQIEADNESLNILIKLEEQTSRTINIGTCLYRKELADGTVLRCGAGMLIPDDVYDPHFEGEAISALVDDHPELLTAMGVNRAQADWSGIVRMLQSVHDNYEPAYWEAQLSDLAGELGLSTAVLDAV